MRVWAIAGEAIFQNGQAEEAAEKDVIMDDGEFLKSLQTKKMLPHTLVLEHVCPATRLLEKRRQMFEVQEALEAHKQEFNRKEEVFKRREEGLKRKDLELQESLIRFSKFLQENDSKRSRAEKKAADEIKSRLQKEKEIEALQDTLEGLKTEKEKVHEILEKNMRYQHYLETVLEVVDEYQEVPELLMRHATLKVTNHDLNEHQKQLEELTEKTRAELQNYVRQKTESILNLNNKLSNLKKELEGYEAEALAHETRKDYSLQVASQKTLEFGQVIMSTDNIFNRCRNRSRIAHPAETNPLEQLEVIGNYISDLGAIIRQNKLEQLRKAQKHDDKNALL
ncbi:hypothetical protein BSKO_09909 [Bryopsis sp. KO-2023]|nr:hypothetical protein BSKO_09909 [Bryopsis sp. KO-2023]